MESKRNLKKPAYGVADLSSFLRRSVDGLMTERMTYIKDLSSDPSDHELNYLATLTDLASQLRTAVILAERTIYFKTKIQ